MVDAWVEGSPEEAAARAATSAGAAAGAASSLTCAAEGGDAPPPPTFPRLHMTVRDTGIGIAQEAMANLFQCFRQVGATAARGTCAHACKAAAMPWKGAAGQAAAHCVQPLSAPCRSSPPFPS